MPSVAQTESYYIVETRLKNGLVTSYKKELPYYPDMYGTADIITEDMSLLQRIFLPLRKIFTEHL